MRLSELIRDLPQVSTPRARDLESDPEVEGICHDSRVVAPGDLFVAWQGERHDGRIFAPQAVERGAVAVLASGPAPEALGVPWLCCQEPRRALGPLAARIYGHPDTELTLVGITGTNGKSTVTALLRAMLLASGQTAGSLGTLGYTLGQRSYPGGRTTPEASDLFRILRHMRREGAQCVVMEVSSHALSQGRVAGARFDVGVFTNLSRDHFDFHPDFEDYFQAKKSLFDQLKAQGRCVVNVEDPYGRRLARELDSPTTYGSGGTVRMEELELDVRGIRGSVVTPRGRFAVRTELLGRYNVSNLLAACAAAEVQGLPHQAMAQALEEQRPLPGRMEPVDRGQPFPVFVDYAHTDAALEAALRSLKELSGAKVALVFGCGGDRDPGKRLLMGRVAGEWADLAIVTDDNPRREDPGRIIEAVQEGLRQSGEPSYRIVPDRRQAIRQAIAQAGPGWCVLVAGKGHEEVQIVGDEERPFSDRHEIEQALEERLWCAEE